MSTHRDVEVAIVPKKGVRELMARGLQVLTSLERDQPTYGRVIGRFVTRCLNLGCSVTQSKSLRMSLL
jgi:hypothetical protein